MNKIGQAKAVLIANKMFAGVVSDIAHLEGNPYSFPEVQTLLDGVTVGGHLSSDQAHVLSVYLHAKLTHC